MKALVGGSWEVLLSKSCKARSSSSRSFYDDLVRFSWGPGMKILPKVFFTCPCAKLVEILVACCQGPLHDLVQFVQVLVRSS